MVIASAAALLLLLPCLLYCFIIGIALLFSAFWIWMLVDCLQNEKTETVVWVVVIIFLHGLGATIYYFVRYKKNRLPGSGVGGGSGSGPGSGPGGGSGSGSGGGGMVV